MNGLRMSKSHAAERIVLLSSALAEDAKPPKLGYGPECPSCDCGPKPGDEREVDYVPPPHGTPIRDWDLLLTQKEDPLVGPYGWVRFFNSSAELVQFTENKKGPSETILAV